MSVQKKISKIVEKWYLCEPLYFAVWTLHKVAPYTQITTIRVQNGHIEYNPIFLNALSENELESVLCFEAMRIILKHPYSRKKDLPEISYLASNITIQEYLKTTGLGFLSAQEFFGSHKFDKKYFEFYYDMILERAQKTCQDEKGNKNEDNTLSDKNDKNEGHNINGENEDDNHLTSEGDSNNHNDNDNSNNSDSVNQDNRKADSGNQDNRKADSGKGTGKANPEKPLADYTNEKRTGFENASNWDRIEYHEQLINEKIKDISIANTWGTITENIQEKILATLKPKINYKMILKSFRASILSDTRRLTRLKPSRRYDFLYMGSRRDFSTKLLFAVDISGSVSHAALKNAFSIINRFFKYGIEEISVICFDTEIKGKQLTLKKAKKEIKILGRGGTSFSAVIDYIDKNRAFDGVIIFTDGYAPCPDPPKNRKTKILWLFDTESNYKVCKASLSKLGMVAFVKDLDGVLS